MTFSILGRCEKTGMMGMAISSSSPAVAARCAHARAKVGVVTSQNITDPSLGPAGLNLLAEGFGAQEALNRLTAGRAHIEHRQLVVLDDSGRAAVFSGAHALGVNATAVGRQCAAAGNLLANDGVPQAMAEAFEVAVGSLGDRLIAAMRAGVKAGGEAGPVHSAGMLVVRDVSWPVADLRVDWTDNDPIEELAKLWDIYAPQLEAYVQRALDPTAAPSYGVPGDE